MPAMLECPELERWEALFASGLSPEEEARYERHLESCPDCQKRLDWSQDHEASFRRLGQQGGDPTLATAEPGLVQVRERLRQSLWTERPTPPAGIDLYFLRACDRAGTLGKLGAYEVEEVIGQGGMGVVLKAFEPALHRHVALKVLAPALAGSGAARQRFTREAKAAAAVRHGHIVTVYGVHEADGLPYLVMEHVAGESLQDRLDRAGPLEPAAVVRIGLQTATACMAAHGHGLIHRDIKPANILLGNDGDSVKLTDFGLARMADDVQLAQNGVVAGTPEYMAPEQARGQVVDHRADLFSLGSVLYAMSTGVSPFRASSTLGVLRRVTDETPAPLRTLNPAMPAWLDELVAGLLAKEPAERYQSAAEVVVLLEGYAAHLDRPATVPAPALMTRRQGDKATRRKWPRLPFLLILSSCLLVVLGLLGRFAGGILGQDAGKQADGGAAEPAPPCHVWSVAVSRDDRFVAGGAGWWDQPGEAGVWELTTRKPLQRFAEDLGVGSVAFSPDGKLLATGSWNGRVHLYDWAAGKEVVEIPTAGMARVAFSPDGTLLATASDGQTAQLWSVPDGNLVADLPGDRFRFQCVAFSPDGKRVLAGGGDWKKGGVSLVVGWDVGSKEQVLKLAGHKNVVLSIAFSPDGKRIATGSADRTVRLWDGNTGTPMQVLSGHQGNIEGLAFAPDGQTLVSGSGDHTLRFWSVARGEETSRMVLPGEVRSVQWTPDGKTLVAGGGPKLLQIIDAASHEELTALWGPTGTQPVHSMDDLPVAASPKPARRLWLAVAAFLGLPIALLWLALHAWRSARRRRRLAPAEAAAPVVPSSVSFPCPSCAKGLKVRPELRGRRVKCPQCGQAVRVPTAEAKEPTSTAVQARPKG